MWIIKDWLCKYAPVGEIIDGGRYLVGVRLKSVNIVPRSKDTYLYIAANRNTGEICLANGKDALYITHHDTERVMNEVLKAFEFYNRWESALLLAACNKDCPEQKIIDLCQGVLGPIIVFDPDFSVVAFSRSYKVGEVNQVFDELLASENKLMLSSLKSFRQTALYSQMFLMHDYTILEDNHTMVMPYVHRVIASCCNLKGKLLAQMVMFSKAQITPAKIDLAKVVEHALKSIPHKRMDLRSPKRSSEILLSYYENRSISESDLEKLMLLNKWRPEDDFAVLCSKPHANFENDAGPHENLLYASTKRLDELIPTSVSFVSSDMLVTCVCIRTLRASLHDLLVLVQRQMNLIIGTSYEFSGFSGFITGVRQSRDALKYRRQSLISTFLDCAIYVLLNECDHDYCQQCIHPVVRKLKMEDQKNKTENAKMFRIFLQSERSYVMTAKRMFFHRNTVYQRVNKILYSNNLDLEKPYTREYLLTSFRFLDTFDSV